MEKYINSGDIWSVSLLIYSSTKGILFGKRKNLGYELISTTLKDNTKDLMDIITLLLIKNLRLYENKYFEYKTVDEFVRIHTLYYNSIPDMNTIPIWIEESINDFENDIDNIKNDNFTYAGILYRYVRSLIERNHMLNVDFVNNQLRKRYYVLDIDNFTKYEYENIMSSIYFYNTKNNGYAKKYRILEWVKQKELSITKINPENKSILKFISLSTW